MTGFINDLPILERSNTVLAQGLAFGCEAE